MPAKIRTLLPAFLLPLLLAALPAPPICAASLPESLPQSTTQSMTSTPQPDTQSVTSAPQTGGETVIFQLESQPDQPARVVENAGKRWNLWGFIAWGIIALGVLLVVLVLLLAALRPDRRGVFRTRYRRKSEADTHAKRILDENRYRKY